MAYSCPRCGGPVQRGYSDKAQQQAGLVGLLFAAAFGAFACKNCGKVLRSEFPSGIRAKMHLISLLMVVCAIGLAIGCLALMAKWG